MSIPSLFTAIKSCNILWIMHELCQCLIFFFSQFSFQNLIMKPFCISHMLSTLFFFWKKSLLIYYIPCCYKHVGIKTQFLLVSSVLVHVWMSDSMLDSQCNIYTSLGSLECSNSSLEVHKDYDAITANFLAQNQINRQVFIMMSQEVHKKTMFKQACIS